MGTRQWEPSDAAKWVGLAWKDRPQETRFDSGGAERATADNAARLEAGAGPQEDFGRQRGHEAARQGEMWRDGGYLRGQRWRKDKEACGTTSGWTRWHGQV